MDETTTQAKVQMETFGREHYSPGAYSLDLSVVKDAPLQMNGQPSTFGEVYRKLRDSNVKEIISEFKDTYVAEHGEIRLDGEIAEWRLRSTMQKLADLLRQGIDPYRVRWFYYTHDWSGDADESHTFFVVYDNKVVSESSHFSSEEPLVLKRSVEDEPVWHSHPYFDEAFEIYWYRKFYTETLTGQLMVLRPDEPILYHFERPQTRNIERDIQFVTQVKIYSLLWIALPLLVALVFPSLKDYMAIVAFGLWLNFLRLWWATRNVGRPE